MYLLSHFSIKSVIVCTIWYINQQFDFLIFVKFMCNNFLAKKIKTRSWKVQKLDLKKIKNLLLNI